MSSVNSSSPKDIRGYEETVQTSHEQGQENASLVKQDFFGKDIQINLERIFPMIVMATMSSGKSTIINALLGEDILPSKNAACTAKVYSILDDDSCTVPKLYLTDKNGKISVVTENLGTELEKANQSDDISNILIVGQVKGVTNTQRSLLIVDTPGPNNSMDTSHEEITRSVFDQITGGLLLYVINATQMGINDDSRFLSLVAEYTNKNPNIKAAFVVNKIDELDFEEESVEDLMLAVQSYLIQHGFKEPDIIPISALSAQLFKKVLNGEPLTRLQYRQFRSAYELFKSNDIDLSSYVITRDSPDMYNTVEVRGHRYTVAGLMRAIDNTGITYLEKYIQIAQILSSGVDVLDVNIIRPTHRKRDQYKKSGLSFEDVVHLMRIYSSYIDTSFIQNHLAVQFDLTGSVTGTFYFEVKGHQIFVEPYEYYDRDALVRVSGETLIKIMTGELSPKLGLKRGTLIIGGNPAAKDKTRKLLSLLYSNSRDKKEIEEEQMKDFSIEYNPDTVEYIFRSNGRELGSQSKFNVRKHEQLQAILGPSRNWKGLLEEIYAVCNSREINLTFKGRRIDFDALQRCVDAYKGEVKFTLELTEVKYDRNIFIEYNPYTVECTFQTNGKELDPKSKFNTKRNERLQAILSSSQNGKGLLEEIDDIYKSGEIKLTFKGRRIDFDDLKYCVDAYKGNIKFPLELIECKNDQDIMQELDKIFAEIQQKNLPEFAQPNKQGKNIFDAYEEVKNGIFDVNVIATMSSGKSTLINSLLHTELLPSKNAACTATIAEIMDDDLQKEFKATCYGKDHKTVVYPPVSATKENLDRYNSDEKVAFIDITGDIPAVSSDKIRLRLRDTPGPNNSRNENHGKRTKEIIQNTNAVVLYVMNATQLGINDDNQLLKDISFEMQKNGKQSRDRFIFVINKCDAFDVERGETLDKTLQSARDYLKGFGIDDPILIPTSALLSLLIRRDKAGEKLSRKERRDLNGTVEDFVETELLHFEDYAVLTPTVKDALRKQVEKYHANEDTWDLEADIHTGIPALEATIAEYIDKYAYPIKIKDAMQDISAILGEINMKSGFEKMIAEDSDKLETVRAQIKEAKEKHQESEETVVHFKKEIDSFGLGDLSRVKAKLELDSSLSPITGQYKSATSVDKAKAHGMIADFQLELDKTQRKYEQELTRKIEQDLFKRGNKMLEEYRSRVTELLGNIQIDGYDFERVYSFQKVRIDNMDDLIRRNETTRYKEVTKWKDNPERQGFFGFFKFWEPKRISYTAQVEDGKDVNVTAVVITTMNSFTRAMQENIDRMFNQSDKQIANYKKVFKANIEALQAEISTLLDQLERDTANGDLLLASVQKNKELLEWVSLMEQRLDTLTSF